MDTFTRINNIVTSDGFKTTTSEIIEHALDALTNNPISFIKLVEKSKNAPSMIRDTIFMECFQVFLLNTYDFDVSKQEYVDENMTSFAEALAEVSPNEESGYEGNPDKLQEYAKRIIKLLDDCGTIQKSYYIACLARSVRDRLIDSNRFFKLSYCVRSLIEEDLLFLKKNISTNVVNSEEEYIEDFRALGLMKDVDGGFAYTKRAFELKKYALDYERKVDIPDYIPKRYIPSTPDRIGEDAIKSLFDDKIEEKMPEIMDQIGPVWTKF